MTATVLRGDALHLPLADNSVDLTITSPPYFGLRSYQDGGVHYDGQLGSEATPVEFVDALLAATREMVRVTKPTGSIFINLGDKYATAGTRQGNSTNQLGLSVRETAKHYGARPAGYRDKSLMGIPWRYALQCIDDLGLILRAELIWSKPNGLPESVTDRVRRSHETWFHFVQQPRYFTAVDEIRESYDAPFQPNRTKGKAMNGGLSSGGRGDNTADALNPLGKLPGSVWSVPTQPLKLPDWLGVNHFAAFPMEWPRRLIQGWSPSGVCTACGEGRRPVSLRGEPVPHQASHAAGYRMPRHSPDAKHGTGPSSLGWSQRYTITGYACACADPTAPTIPSVILDPFGGTGTTATVARALGRHAITLDYSRDYCRAAQWRTNDPGELARALEVDKPAVQVDGQVALFDLPT